MSGHPVQLHVDDAGPRARVHVLIRLILLVALGGLGCSSLYWLLYLGLPAVTALYISSRGADGFLRQDAPRLVRGLRWLAAAYAYLWLLTDAAPASASEPAGPVSLQVDVGGRPSVGSALARLLYSLPALVVLAVLSFFAGVFWIVGAVAILLTGRLPRFVADLVELTLRYQFRLIAYHLSIVERYPDLSEADAARPLASADAGAA